MARYRCRVLQPDGNILLSEEMTGQTLEEALQEARDLFTREAKYPILELLDGDRVIHFESRPAVSH